MAIEVFMRYEKKYFVPKAVYEELLGELRTHMILDSYNQNGIGYRIDNIYYDTKNNDLIRRSIDRPIYKEKLRLRSYGVVKPEDKVFLEIKKKYDGLVNKRRIKIRLSDAEEFIRTGETPIDTAGINLQVLKELQYFINHYEVIPAIYLSYDRVALFGVDEPEFRVTLDTNIRARRYDLTLSAGDYGDQILEQNVYLMEAKTVAAYPLWFVSLLEKYSLKSVSFSKYGTEYKRTAKLARNNQLNV